MNSTMIGKNVSSFLRAQDNTAFIQLLKASAVYQQATQSGITEKIRNAYQTLLSLIRDGEAATGIQIISSDDGSFLCAVAAFAALTCRTWEEMQNETKTIQFPSVFQANEWLRKQTNIALKSVQVQTRTALGLFANHTEANNIIITYHPYALGTLCRYGIAEVEKTHWLFHDKCENFQKDWELENPGAKCLFLQSYTNSRQNANNPFRCGIDYIEHNKFFITFSKPLAAAAAAV